MKQLSRKRKRTFPASKPCSAGAPSELIRAGFETLVRAGYSPELAYFECLHELKFIVDLIHEAGIAGMSELISDSAQWGALTVGPKIIDRSVRRRMDETLRDIRSGKFARNFIREIKEGRRTYNALLKKGKDIQLNRSAGSCADE